MSEVLNEISLNDVLSRSPEYGANASAQDANGYDPRYLRITDIDDAGNLLYDDIRSIPLKIAEPYLLSQDDIVIARTGNTVGKSYIHNYVNGQLAYAGYLIRFKINTEKASPRFIFQYLHSPYYYSWLNRTLRTGAQPNVNATEYKTLPLPDFQLGEQRKIAKILSTVDNLIEKTQTLIDKYQSIKQGMMRDLFTRGVDENGQLRPSYEEAPHLYKESELGWIPKEWEVETLGRICMKITDGTHQAVTTSLNGEIPFLFVSCIGNEEIKWDKAAKLSNEVYTAISKGREPKEGVILYSAVGSYGNASLISGDEPFSFQRHIAIIYPDSTVVLPAFLVKWINTPTMKSYADSVAVGNAQKSVTLGMLKDFPVVVPSIIEQRVIFRRLEGLSKLIQSEDNYLKKLVNKKKGLMQDLLTGKVRVSVDSEDKAVT